MTSPRDGEVPAQPAAGQITTAATPAAPQPVKHHAVHRTRMSGLWVGLTLSAVVLLLLLVFILENGQKAKISYFGAHGQLPLGVALLLSAVAGALLVIIPGTGRILQLRRVARRHRVADATRREVPAASAPAAAEPPPGSGAASPPADNPPA
ncbi:MAG TPA: lipopolysaccharide assembly protein LapA domain-containing protein [Streptosporangiaceae bacterium]